MMARSNSRRLFDFFKAKFTPPAWYVCGEGRAG